MTATGEPRVLPWRTPARISSSSCSTRILAPRPKPRRRRASSPAMPSLDTTRPAGRPSTVATSPGPWDSPAVRKRNMAPRWYRQWPEAQVRSVVEKMMAAQAPSISGGPYGERALRPFPMASKDQSRNGAQEGGDDQRPGQDPIGLECSEQSEQGRQLHVAEPESLPLGGHEHQQ